MSGKKPEQTVEAVLARINRPSRVVVTAGMPYANGPLHLGHLAGAQIPADICARYHKMLIGDENVVFVCGTDDHGSTSEVAAIKAGKGIHEFIAEIHELQKRTMENYGIDLDNYSGTSTPETFELHKENCQEILRQLHKNGLITKKTSKQWFDPKVERFLPDRYVNGTCPSCGADRAYSDQCDTCGAEYDPNQLLDPKSTISDATPELRDTDHWWLNMWALTDPMIQWIESRKRLWRKGVYNEVINTVQPVCTLDKAKEDDYKEIKGKMPKHKARYAPGKQVALQFNSLKELEEGREQLREIGIATELKDGWAYRSITRDVSWGIPLPLDLDPEMEGKTLYVWPDSLIAPIAFTQQALKNKGQAPEAYKDYWNDPNARQYQFLGQDNVFFYVLMQGALWLGSQEDSKRLPVSGEKQLTDVFGCFHLQINGEKMSKSTGNFFTGDQLLDEKGADPDQLRYYLALLSLAEKRSNFDEEHFAERNRFLAGPMNAAFEKPISACLKKFGGVVPEGKILEKAQKETYKIVQKYVRQMERAEYSTLLYAIENYVRQINSLFAQHKPHDDRFPGEQRADALFTCFYILKNIMIMLYPFAPATMDRLRESLNLSKDVLSIDQLGTSIEAGHKIGEMLEFFPNLDED